MAGKDPLGKPFKALEEETQIVMPHDQLIGIRIDGKNFSNWTRDLEKPFSWVMSEAMKDAGIYLCKQIDKAAFAYIQSDECSIIVAPALEEHWFGGKVQKITSVTASMFTAEFNTWNFTSPACFDARVFRLPDAQAVADYMRWRQLDNNRNFVNLVAREYFSHKELLGVSHGSRLEMLKQEGVIIDEVYNDRFRQGVLIYKDSRIEDVEYLDRRTNEIHVKENVERSFWADKSAPRLDTVERLEPYLEMERVKSEQP